MQTRRERRHLAAPHTEPLTLESGHRYVPPAIRPQVPITSKIGDKWRAEARKLFRPSRNGYNDPLSHLFVIDTLMRIAPGQVVRAHALRDTLATEAPQVSWDTQTVGRIMAELVVLAYEVAPRGTEPAIDSARDFRSTYFTIAAGPAAYNWLIDLRHKASAKFQSELDYLAQGLEPASRGLPVWEIDKGGVC